jgi:hypothetical protein
MATITQQNKVPLYIENYISDITLNNGILTKLPVVIDNSLTVTGTISSTGGLGTVYSEDLTPASVAADTSAEQTFTVSGLVTGQAVVVNGPAPTAGTGIVNARVSAADTLALTFGNFTAAALTPAAGTYLITQL